MIRYFISLFLLIFILLTVSACLFNERSDKNVVITVGDQAITSEDIVKEVNITAFENGIPRRVVWESIDDLIDRIVDNSLILEFGKAKGINLTDAELQKAIENIVKDYPDNSFKETILTACIEYDEWKARFRKQLLVEKITKKEMESLPPIPYPDVKSYYQERKEEFWHPPRAKYMHIVSRARKDAEAILTRIKEGEDMAELVREKSHNSGLPGEDGKDWRAKDTLPEPLSDIVFSMPLGKLSDIIETKYGFHIIKVLQREPEGEKELLEVSNDIEKRLLAEARERHYLVWLGKLRNNYTIKVDHASLNGIRARMEESKS